MSRVISAFGSSCIAADDPRYRDVCVLAQQLAQAGWQGQVGGHQGMMAAFSQGMAAGGGSVRGVTLHCFPTPSDHTLSAELRCDDFFHRMKILIEECDAWLVLPGGLGTLSEFAMCWDLKAIDIIAARPLILYGDGWRPLLAAFESVLEMSVAHAMDMVTVCSRAEQVVAALDATA
ncbi:MAG: LOG family protein [Mariprofundales bacterium]|nr:LOG family protein [Mariprofundales bacterium]